MNPSKVSPLFSVGGRPVPANKSSLSIGELRSLGEAVKTAHPLRGALRLIDNEWVVGIKLPTRLSAEHVSALMCFRWDGHFGSALSLTVGNQSKGWLARAWIWSQHPAMLSLRTSRSLTIASFYNGEPIAVLRAQALGEQSLRGIEFATDPSNECDRRPDKQPLDFDEELAYWETFALSNTWDSLLTVTDHLKIGWLREFRKGLRFATIAIKEAHPVPLLSDEEKSHWTAGGRPCPLDFWTGSILPLAEVLRGDTSILNFVRNNSASSIILVIADEECRRNQNPFHDLRWIIGILAECSLLADTRTQFGQRVVFSSLNTLKNTATAIPAEELSVASARIYWENLPSVTALNVGELVHTDMQPADLESIADAIRNIRLTSDTLEAENAVVSMTEEANILNRWTIPWGARVQTNIGPFTEIDFYPYGDEISILLKTPAHDYRWAAFNLRKDAWNLDHIFTNRLGGIGMHFPSENIGEIEVAIKLILASIVRDFVVVEERESVFAIRRDFQSKRRRSDDSEPRVIYIPRVRYNQRPDTSGLQETLEYDLRRPHHVRAHQRRADTVSPFQRTLAERYGFRLEPGFTFVKPHQRGGISTDREIIYRSRSAMQSLYGIDASIVSDGRSDWFRFERDVHDAMVRDGYKVDHVASAKNGDAGIDVFATNSTGTESWAIQCKCYAPQRKVGPSVVRELLGALAAYPEGTSGMIVTTSGYSSGAIKLAKDSGIVLKLLAPSTSNSTPMFNDV